MQAAADCSMRASGSSVRSTTSSSACSPGATGSCPAALSAPCSFEPNSRSGHSRATLATPSARLLRAPARELLAHRLRAAPHLNDLHAARTGLAERELALDSLAVQQSERAADRLRRSRMTELVRAADPPVPVVLRVRHGVDLHEQRRSVDVAVLVCDAKVELQLRPVGRQRVEQALEVVGERHAPHSLRLSVGALDAHRALELVPERVLATIRPHGERSAEGLSASELELVARRDAALGEVAQHVRVGVGYARE